MNKEQTELLEEIIVEETQVLFNYGVKDFQSTKEKSKQYFEMIESEINELAKSYDREPRLNFPTNALIFFITSNLMKKSLAAPQAYTNLILKIHLQTLRELNNYFSQTQDSYPAKFKTLIKRYIAANARINSLSLNDELIERLYLQQHTEYTTQEHKSVMKL